jgi:hypothetical protein
VTLRYSAEKRLLRGAGIKQQRLTLTSGMRRMLYLECNRLYQAKLREQKLKSWKDFCTSIDSSNPWNAVYRYAAAKLRRKPTLSTLSQQQYLHNTFTKQEIQAVLEKFDPRKATGEDAMNSEIILRTFRSFPTFYTELYECLRKGIFPKRKRSIMLPIVKPGTEGINRVSKYRPISLLNIGGKVI